jgi:hypothetical protein
LDKTIPVKPPKVKRKIKPKDHKVDTLEVGFAPKTEESHEKILIPVGIAIIIVAAVK